MTETSFDGVKITWEQVAYLQSILSSQEFIAFLQMKPVNTPKPTGMFSNQRPDGPQPGLFSNQRSNTPMFGKRAFNSA
jgi:hypothetical protein